MKNTICDKCNNYYVHPSGVSESCREVEKNYFAKRSSGEIIYCKMFSKLKKEKEEIKKTD